MAPLFQDTDSDPFSCQAGGGFRGCGDGADYTEIRFKSTFVIHIEKKRFAPSISYRKAKVLKHVKRPCLKCTPRGQVCRHNNLCNESPPHCFIGKSPGVKTNEVGLEWEQ